MKNFRQKIENNTPVLQVLVKLAEVKHKCCNFDFQFEKVKQSLKAY